MGGGVVFVYLSRLWRRFREEQFGQLAGSLAFTTLLSIVPLVAVALTVGSSVPIFAKLVGHVDSFFIDNLLPGKTGGVVSKYTVTFSQKAKKLTLPGLALLALTSLMLMFSIEKAFNHLWRVRKPRRLDRRIGLYLVIVVAGPVVAGGVIATLSFAVSLSVGFFNEPVWLRPYALKAVALTLMCAFFAFLYYAVPNVRVRLSHAVFGGVLATLGVAGIQQLFELYVIKFPTYTVLYGAFAALPIFLAWIYLCWIVVLVGALIVANFNSSEGRGFSSR